MTGRPKLTLAEGKKHLARVLEQLEGGRWQLLGILHNLPEPPAEVGHEDVPGEWDGVMEMRTVIECVLEDYIRPAHQDLQDLLANPGEEKEEEKE